MNKVKFSFTVDSKRFPHKIANLLEEQIEDTEFFSNTSKALESLRNGRLELFLTYMAETRQEIALLLDAMTDAEDNVMGFIEARNSKTEQTKEEKPQQIASEPKVDVIQPAADPFAQLQQLQSLVNTIKDLKPKE
jgi:hypothetical protein